MAGLHPRRALRNDEVDSLHRLDDTLIKLHRGKKLRCGTRLRLAEARLARLVDVKEPSAGGRDDVLAV